MASLFPPRISSILSWTAFLKPDVSVSMKVLTYNDLSMTNPGYWAFLTHQVVKETMATVAGVDNIIENFDL